ncbi:N-acetylmuramoyl-L-alanine amidase [Anaeromicropila herbilytica]|uniref:Bacteriophage endolysin (N-acetylmuramoyl-L-alanine amidase) n=1 Tax=Anaeromicropila herbilytica TaxID=2785025 RepID=A0A7R7EN72_9FIRM|nr:N-acetylmuramoyl-L-alanine amidase [Anaeromicropila herbilytica]BCN32050.1 bacteriophage endolysin (N-acetylmuramoyl-L-alanine amidase) [Anaeromicropila herbilytica]
MRINIHAGHNPDGKVACGAVGILEESTEARKVKDSLIKILKYHGHTVYDCTVNNGMSQSDVLAKIIKKSNAHKVDLDVSIHFNSGRNDYDGDNKNGGVEVFIYSEDSKGRQYAEEICKKVQKLGYNNRGIKINNNLYVLKHSLSSAILVECCFVDDVDDAMLYDYDRMAIAIASGILGENLLEAIVTKDNVTLHKSESLDAISIGNLRKGDKVNVLRIRKLFIKVRIDGRTGWVYKKYLKSL